jgi:hypothetical protein
MEGECYAFVWGRTHFWQYFHQVFFLLRTNHKPLEWLAIVFNTYECRVDGFPCFKIVHYAGSKHANVDALSINPMDMYEADEDFGNEM